MEIDEEDVQKIRNHILVTIKLSDLERIMAAMANQKFINYKNTATEKEQRAIDDIFNMVEIKVYETIKRIREGYYSESDPKYHKEKA